jgi:hypothetical protein
VGDIPNGASWAAAASAGIKCGQERASNLPIAMVVMALARAGLPDVAPQPIS